MGCVLAAGVLGLSACGGSGPPDSRSTSGSGGTKTVDIYSSLPLHGQAAVETGALVNGMRLALSQAGGRAGRFTVDYRSLDDSVAGKAQWDPVQTAANARLAAVDPKAVYYIGEFNSSASEVSIPILNESGVPQVSPANTAVGLTTADPGHQPGEPQKYYPAGKRTFLRIVPRDTIQGAVADLVMKNDGCKKVAVANDKQAYGAGLAIILESDKRRYGLNIVSNSGIDVVSSNFRSYAQSLKSQGVDCFYFAGVVDNGAVQITKDVNAALPGAKIYGGDGICTSAYTNPADHGVPAGIDPKIQCTLPTQSLTAYPGGRRFLAAYRAKFGGGNPNPYAIYGYEAMELGLNTIATLGERGNEKSAVLAALFATHDRHSVLGTYGFDQNGDTTLTSYGLYKVGKRGDPQFERTVTP